MLLRNNGTANPKCNNVSAVCKSVNATKNTLALLCYAWVSKIRRQRGNRHNLPPLRSPRRKNKTWKVQCVCVSKRKLMAQNLHWSTAEFRVRVFSPTSSGQNRWLPVTWTGFLGREGGISNVWKNAGKKLTPSSSWVRPLKWWVYNITEESHFGFIGRGLTT